MNRYTHAFRDYQITYHQAAGAESARQACLSLQDIHDQRRALDLALAARMSFCRGLPRRPQTLASLRQLIADRARFY